MWFTRKRWSYQKENLIGNSNCLWGYHPVGVIAYRIGWVKYYECNGYKKKRSQGLFDVEANWGYRRELNYSQGEQQPAKCPRIGRWKECSTLKYLTTVRIDFDSEWVYEIKFGEETLHEGKFVPKLSVNSKH